MVRRGQYERVAGNVEAMDEVPVSGPVATGVQPDTAEAVTSRPVKGVPATEKWVAQALEDVVEGEITLESGLAL